MEKWPLGLLSPFSWCWPNLLRLLIGKIIMVDQFAGQKTAILKTLRHQRNSWIPLKSAAHFVWKLEIAIILLGQT